MQFFEGLTQLAAAKLTPQLVQVVCPQKRWSTSSKGVGPLLARYLTPADEDEGRGSRGARDRDATVLDQDAANHATP